MDGASVKEMVRKNYAKAALTVLETGGSACCGPSCGPAQGDNIITSNLYNPEEQAQVPESAFRASLGCGSPTALAELHQGETVLDLGAGGGMDVFLSARRVGPTGKAIGLDMTDEMLRLAEENRAQAGVPNAEFLKGDIEHIPLPDATVDVVISNCVINLSADKGQVFREAFRVLKPGGRFAVSDIVSRGELPEPVRRNWELWAGCVAGALPEAEFRSLLSEAGFEDISVEPTRIYKTEDARAFLRGTDLSADMIPEDSDGLFMSAFIRARRPEAA